LHDRLARLGASTLLDALPAHCKGTLTPVQQSATGTTYASKLTKAEAQLDFSETSLQIHRKIRAFNPWPVAEARLLDKRVRIWQSRMIPANALSERLETGRLAGQAAGTIVHVASDALLVSTGDGMIELLQLQWPGKKMQDVRSFSQGHELAGERFTTP
jgi:methionyl-tRNA formyltransferase